MGGLWSVLCWAFLVAQTLFFIWMFHKFLFHSYSSFSKFAIQIRNSDDIFSGLLFWFFWGFDSYTGVFITITSTLGKKKIISFVRTTARIYGKNISESLEWWKWAREVGQLD